MDLKKNTRLIILISILMVLSFITVGALVFSNSQNQKINQNLDKVEITDAKNGTKVTFSKDGYVSFQDKDGKTRSEIWDPAKISSFFDYINKNLKTSQNGYLVSVNVNGQIKTGSLPSSDELIKIIISGGGGSGSGGPISQYFNGTPTPNLGGSQPPGSQTPPPDAPSWCIHWRLSYCADYLYPPTPSPSPSPVPGSYINPSDCTEWDSNCNKTTPTPNPNPYGY